MHKYSSLLDMFEQAAAETSGLIFFEKNEPQEHAYSELLQSAKDFAEKLVTLGVEPEQKVLLVLSASSDLVTALFGTIYAGAIPCILPELSMVKVIEDGIEKTIRIANQLSTEWLVTNEFNRDLYQKAGTSLNLNTINEISALEKSALPSLNIAVDDVAVIQATSGSTGTPKCVMLTHGNLLSNLEQICHGTVAQDNDCVVAWLPFYHDMGLIGCFLYTVYRGIRGVFMTPSHFLRRPLMWLKAIEEYKGTLSPAPNFAYAYCCVRISKDKIAELDLSSWRGALCGAEMVDADVLRFFAMKFYSAGFNPTSFVPCYGMAEASLAVTMHTPRTPLNTEVISRSALAATGTLEKPKDPKDATEVVDCGAVLPGAEVRIVSDEGADIGEERLGHIQVKSPSVMKGYFADEERTSETLKDSWLVTGDLGFIKNGHLFITGREKDLIIIRGEKYLPTDFEKVAAITKGVREGRAAAFGVYDTDESTERLYLVCELDDDWEDKEEIVREAIAKSVSTKTGILPCHIGFVPRDTIPKTTSGKLQRGHLRKMYLDILSQAD